MPSTARANDQGFIDLTPDPMLSVAAGIGEELKDRGMLAEDACAGEVMFAIFQTLVRYSTFLKTSSWFNGQRSSKED